VRCCGRLLALVDSLELRDFGAEGGEVLLRLAQEGGQLLVALLPLGLHVAKVRVVVLRQHRLVCPLASKHVAAGAGSLAAHALVGAQDSLVEGLCALLGCPAIIQHAAPALQGALHGGVKFGGDPALGEAGGLGAGVVQVAGDLAVAALHHRHQRPLLPHHRLPHLPLAASQAVHAVLNEQAGAQALRRDSLLPTTLPLLSATPWRRRHVLQRPGRASQAPSRPGAQLAARLLQG
jgi:hypothetical protein